MLSRLPADGLQLLGMVNVAFSYVSRTPYRATHIALQSISHMDQSSRAVYASRQHESIYKVTLYRTSYSFVPRSYPLLSRPVCALSLYFLPLYWLSPQMRL